jgi:Heparinase II/III-like protein/Heparinase II/III N-terminus
MKGEKPETQDFILHPSALILKLRRVLRGEVSARTAALEAGRRIGLARSRRRERAELAELNLRPARLREEFAHIRAADLLAHFHSRTSPRFFSGFQESQKAASLQREMFPAETVELITQAHRMTDEHCFPLLGFGEKCLGREEIQWSRDPLSNFDWPLIYHADINLIRNDGSDARVLWELNRLGHLISLGRAYATTKDEKFSSEFFRQVYSWRQQNPVARGVNWNCAMEGALRVMNLLAAFVLFLRSPQMNETSLKDLLQIFDQHGAHIRRNLEFSHIATSNHYLSDVTGLLWLGVMLPELEGAKEWREFGLRELLSEMEKQVLPDGTDYEASTGYHRLKLELFLYSFVLCHLNGINIEEKYWHSLRAMVDYLSAYLRSDGRAPLIGDSDSGQVLPITGRRADDHAYLLALGAAVFQESRFKFKGLRPTEELIWILGAEGLGDFQALPANGGVGSRAFADAGTYILRDRDLYLLFNASESGVLGRGSHGHNDALSIEVSACGTPFIVDPGSYLYTADLHERHLFRSTAWHSTVQIDGAEQNTIAENLPFIIGNEARPRVLEWESTVAHDTLVAEHFGYQRLPQPVIHSRRIVFNKEQRYWSVSDRLTGTGEHEVAIRFHFAPGLEARVLANGTIDLCDKMNGSRLLIEGRAGNAESSLQPELEARFSSGDYGAKKSSVAGVWTTRTVLPFAMQFVLVPVCAGENQAERLEFLGLCE